MKKSPRKLVLKKETLAELTATELRDVVGAQSGAPCELTKKVCDYLSTPCIPTCGPMCTGTSTTATTNH